MILAKPVHSKGRLNSVAASVTRLKSYTTEQLNLNVIRSREIGCAYWWHLAY